MIHQKDIFNKFILNEIFSNYFNLHFPREITTHIAILMRDRFQISVGYYQTAIYGEYTYLMEKYTGYNQKFPNDGMIFFGSENIFKLMNNGDLYYLAYNLGSDEKIINPQKIELPYKIKDVICGGNVTFVISRSGKLYMWKTNTLPIMINVPSVKSLAVGYNVPPVKLLAMSYYDFSATGSAHVLALALDGSIYAWGCNKYGQLGIGKISKKIINDPQKIESNTKFTSISAGYNFSAAIDKNGYVYVWGRNDLYTICYSSNEDYITRPTKIKSLKNAISISCSATCIFVLTEQHKVYGWGYDDQYSGILGLGAISIRGNVIHTKSPCRISLPPIKEIQASRYYVIAVSDKDVIYTWGTNATKYYDRHTPTILQLPDI